MSHPSTLTCTSIESLERSLFEALAIKGASYLKAEAFLLDGLPTLEVESDLQEDPWQATIQVDMNGKAVPLIEHVRVLISALEARSNPLESPSKCQQLHVDCAKRRLSFTLTAEPTSYSAWEYAIGAAGQLAH